MDPDDAICLCHHVALRKLLNHVRRHHPRRASEMSECLGAGTGCGWCIPTLRRIFEQSQAAGAGHTDLPISPEEYARQRQEYLERQESKSRP